MKFNLVKFLFDIHLASIKSKVIQKVNVVQRDKNQSYGVYLIILVTMKSILEIHLKPGIVSITIFVCHSPYYKAFHYFRMYSIPVAQAKGPFTFLGTTHLSGIPRLFHTFVFPLKASNW